MSIDPEKVAAAIAEIAETEIMGRFGKLAPEEIREKSGPSDLVTEVDEAVERKLRVALHGFRPDAAFIGEEAATREPAIMQAIANSDLAWIVDPLDGTRNFIRGVEEFGVMVALVERGRTRAGWIYAAPLRRAAIAVENEGARFAGAPMAAKPARRDRLIGLRSLGWLPMDQQGRMRARLAAHFQSADGHCSAYAYLKLAQGEVDFKLSSRIHPWDHAAGALLLNEIGGTANFLDSRKPYEPGPSIDAPLLAVAAGRDWAGIAKRLKD